MEQEKIELYRQLTEQQQKFTYYLIALCVTSIGFSIYLTMGKPFSINYIPLGFAIVSWGSSIFLGLKYLKYMMSIINANIEYLNIKSGQHPHAGRNPELIKAGMEGVMNAMDSNIKKASLFFRWQNYLFITGMILFIVYHIISMYLKSVGC
jgi:hypothetical protein